MKYKPGDEVFVKAEITDISDCEERPYFVAPDCRSIYWVSEDKIIPMDKTYADGLSDAWELAKKILEMPHNDYVCMFGDIYTSKMMENLTAAEAIAKIEAHEKKIKVNDIVKVKDESGFGIVTAVCPTGIVYVLWDDGGCGDYEPCELEKTGRTAEGLDLLLRQIKE